MSSMESKSRSKDYEVVVTLNLAINTLVNRPRYSLTSGLATYWKYTATASQRCRNEG